MKRHPGHPEWCAGGHQCTAQFSSGEHRADPISARVPGSGSMVLTRVGGGRGPEFAEIRLSVVLPADEQQARRRLVALMTHLQALIGPETGTRAVGARRQAGRR